MGDRRPRTADGEMDDGRLTVGDGRAGFSACREKNTLRVFVTLWFIIYLTTKSQRHEGEEILCLFG
jgi:hypothetical protein